MRFPWLASAFALTVTKPGSDRCFISDDVQTLVSLGDYVLGCDFRPDHDRSVSTGLPI